MRGVPQWVRSLSTAVQAWDTLEVVVSEARSTGKTNPWGRGVEGGYYLCPFLTALAVAMQEDTTTNPSQAPSPAVEAQKAPARGKRGSKGGAKTSKPRHSSASKASKATGNLWCCGPLHDKTPVQGDRV